MERSKPRGAKALAVALDLEPAAALRLGGALAAEVGYLKVGLSLFCSEGPSIVRALQEKGARIFLDLKLNDIPNTVELAARALGRLGVDLITVHALGGEAAVRAAVQGLQDGAAQEGLPAPRVLAVTVLTSLDETALSRLGLSGTPAEAVERLAALALGAGAHGLVCSPREARRLRERFGPQPLLVTPGIRPAGSAAQDQARAETPQAALDAGADVLVIGRPILQAASPVEAARQIAASLG